MKKIKKYLNNFTNYIKKNKIKIETDILFISSFLLIYFTTFKLNQYIANYLLSLFLIFIAIVINKK